MALSQKHRNALYAHFAPAIGDDVTEAFLAEFPAREGDDLVTKSFHRAELAELRTQMAQLDARLTAQMAQLDTKLTAQMNALDARLTAQLNDLDTKLTGQIWQVRDTITQRLTTLVLSAVGALIAAGGLFTTIAVNVLR